LSSPRSTGWANSYAKPLPESSDLLHNLFKIWPRLLTGPTGRKALKLKRRKNARLILMNKDDPTGLKGFADRSLAGAKGFRGLVLTLVINESAQGYRSHVLT
jgi:hypothetical protein